MFFPPLCDIMLGVLFSPCRFDVSAEDNFSFGCVFSSVLCREGKDRRKEDRKQFWSALHDLVAQGWLCFLAGP